jgi:uncharacterized RDD family membrane protein YckC/DNA-binding transcriptional ArsR family regulator
MAVDQDRVSKILDVLSHRLRREILLMLSEKSECSFTELLNALNVDTGKLSFHIRVLSAFVEQTPNGKYKLNRTGENAVRVIKDVESWSDTASVKRKTSGLPLASFESRVYAFLVDALIAFVTTALLTLSEALSLLVGSPFRFNVGQTLVVAAIFLWIYSTLLEGFNGQTIGKHALALRVVMVDGKKTSYEHSAVRNFGKAFLLPIDLLIGLRLKNEMFIRYFDKFAGTTVITLR